MVNSDSCVSFYLMEGKIKGHFCRASDSIENALRNHSYPSKINQILAEMAVVSQCFVANVKSDFRAIMQLTGKMPIKTTIVDLHKRGFFRCCATFADPILSNEKYYSLALPELFGSERCLLFSMDFDQQRYQTVIPLKGSTLQDCFQYYFDQSDQIPSIVLCTSDAFGNEVKAAALILQKMPEEQNHYLNCTSDDDSWEIVKLFAQTIKSSELLDFTIPMSNFIRLLFAEFNSIVSRETAIKFKCSCSAEKIKETLTSLSIKGGLDVLCEFCAKKYYIDTENKSL